MGILWYGGAVAVAGVSYLLVLGGEGVGGRLAVRTVGSHLDESVE